jgi:ADP-ribosylation factor GTPase-activating protein 1
MASAANKEEYFARVVQQNQNKPDHLPPSQGGKYVGFGSAPPPRPAPTAAGVDDVTAMLSKGLQSLGHVAGAAATTATHVVQSGTQNLNHMLQEKQVSQTLQQTSKVVAEKAQVGCGGCTVCVCVREGSLGRLRWHTACGHLEQLQGHQDTQQAGHA